MHILNSYKIFLVGACVLGLVIVGLSVIANADEDKTPWVLSCADADKLQCEIVQRLNTTENGQRIVEFAIARDDAGDRAKAVVILPLGILLQPGVLLKIDKHKPYQFSVRHCQGNGCYGYINMPAVMLEHFKKGENAVMIVQDTRGGKLQIPLSLHGFTKAFDRL